MAVEHVFRDEYSLGLDFVAQGMMRSSGERPGAWIARGMPIETKVGRVFVRVCR